jgi:uridine kinase
MKFNELLESFLEKRSEVPAERAMLAGISGIDASGKGYISKLVSDGLERHGLRVALINVDGWLNLPPVRFDPADPAGNFYRNALRAGDMFEDLIVPLRDLRSIEIEVDHAEETASEYRRHVYCFKKIDIIIFEGIFLFKREYTKHFDLKIWVECSFKKALARAVERSQEGLTPEETTKAYLTTYFPAQILHGKFDDPKNAADIIFANNL